MSGYKWDPVFRVVPRNGAETLYWLTDELTDVKSHTKVVLRYVESMDVREDINRSLRPVVHGVRPEVEIECVILSMSDHHFLSEIESALLLPNHYNVFLSLDGGVIEREVVLRSLADPEPLRGKTILGAKFRLELRCVDLIPRRPAMMTDPLVGRDLVEDGSMENWIDTSNLIAWATTPTVLTLLRAPAEKYDGAYSARVTKNNADFGQFVAKTSAGSLKMKKGAWYRFRGACKGTTDLAVGSYRAQVYNANNQFFVNPDGKTWTLNSGDLVSASVSASAWTMHENHLRIPDSFKETDVIYLRFSGYFTVGESIYYDAVSVYGPALRPGYSTW